MAKNFRKIPPVIRQITSIELPETEVIRLENGILLTVIPSGTQDIIKLEVVHRAGRSAEDTRLAARATALLMREGTHSMTAEAFARKIDYYGASIKSASNMDFSYATLYTLGKFLPEVLPVYIEQYTQPTFSEEEIEKFKKTNIQKLLEELAKNDVITYRQITSRIFGDDHPYGYNSEVEDYISLKRTDILHHFDKYYGTDNCCVFLSGHVTPEITDKVCRALSFPLKHAHKKAYHSPHLAYEGKKFISYSRNEHQAAVKIGRKLFDRKDPDHPSFYMLNMILGGYFGSRLMSSIREKLGYTYDIFSSMDLMLYDGLFYVSTEVSPQFVQPTIEEVYRQMEKLCMEPVSKEELQMVRNYIMGNFLNFMDGPLNVSSFIRNLVIAGITREDFNQFNEKIVKMGPEELMQTAQKYLDQKSMAEVIVLPEQNLE